MVKGIIGKFAAGVASVAVPAALENQRAEIQRMRDDRFREWQVGDQATARQHQVEDRQDDQQFRRTEREAGQEFTAEQNKAHRDVTLESPDRAASSDILELSRAYRASEDPAEREQIAQNIMAASGRPETASSRATAAGGKATANAQDVASMVASGLVETEAEGWAIVRGLQNPTQVIAVAKMLQKAQDDQLLPPSAEGYMTPQEMIEQAGEIVREMSGSPARGPAAAWMNSPEASQVAADYDAGKIDRDEARARLEAIKAGTPMASASDGAPTADREQPAVGEEASDSDEPDQVAGRSRPGWLPDPTRGPAPYDPEQGTARHILETMLRPAERWLNETVPGRADRTRGGLISQQLQGPEPDVARPRNAEDIANLEAGTKYVDPRDGKVKVAS